MCVCACVRVCVCACVRVCVRVCVRACVTEYDHSGVLDTVDKICSWTNILMFRLSANKMGGTMHTRTVKVSEISSTPDTTT